MKIITNPISNIPKLANSHVRGWSQVWAEQLEADIDHKCSANILNADLVYIEHGVNFGGTLNLFGGATEDIFNRINNLVQCAKVISLDFDMPNWGEQLRSRIGAPTTYDKIDEAWCDGLSAWCKQIPSFKQEQIYWLDGVSVGDSHTPAFSRGKDVVLRENGKTLFGTLKRGLKNEFRGMHIPSNTITFSLGSIDVRHHLLRHEDKLEDLIKEYIKQGKEIEHEFNSDVWYCAPVPVEYEARKLPKSGYYKGTPFYGSRQERLDLTFRFIELLNKYSGKVVMPPEDWYYMDGEKYAKKYMENSSSVHISPEYYRRYDWGVQDTSLENFFG